MLREPDLRGRGRLIVGGFCFVLLLSNPGFAQYRALSPLRAIESAPGPGTLERVNYALELAQLGAENDMRELSLTAVQRALGNGPPISLSSPGGPAALATTAGGFVMMAPQGSGDAGYQNVLREIEVRLAVLDGLWREHEFPPEEVYATLRSVVLPSSRGGEIFLYARPVLMQPSQQVVVYSQLGAPITTLEVGSAGKLLAEWAVASDHADELRQELSEYESNPRSRRPAAVLLGQLAIAEADGETLKRHLEELDRYLGQDTTQNAAELACHVALPALGIPEAREAALPLLTRVVDNATPSITSEGTNIETLASILRTNARTYFDVGEADEGRRMLDKFLQVHQVNNQRYGGEYPLYLRKQQLGVVAFELLRAGDVESGLARLGERADIRTIQDYGTVSDAGLAGVLARGLGRLSIEERFATLLAFTFPDGRPNHLRTVTEFVRMDSPPPVFLESANAGDKAQLQNSSAGVGGDLLSTAILLIDTAREVGQLDEVIGRLSDLAERDVEFASDLLMLANLSDGNEQGVAQRITELTDEVREVANQNQGRPTYPMHAHLFASQTAQQRQFAQASAAVFTQLIAVSRKNSNDPLRSHARWAHANAIRNRFGSASEDLLLSSSPDFWDPAGFETAAEHASGTVPNVWFAQTGMINHVCGPRDANLFFRYPLAGDFEFSLNGQDGTHAEGNLSYGGVSVEIQGWGRRTVVYPDGRMRQSERQSISSVRSGRFNRQAVEVRDGVVTFFVNGYRIYEDQASNNPWLALHADWGRNPVFTDLQLRGNPIIPREVKLLGDEQLRGWIGSYYGETQPNPLLTVKTASGSPVISDEAEAAQAAGKEWDWSYRDGALHGRKLTSASGRSLQSRIYYHRPLQDGDVVRYEFFHEPGQVDVFPTLGRLAFLIEADGVSLHWMTDGDAESTDVAADNRVRIGEEQVGGRPLPLQPGEWNRVELELRDGVARISLNDVAIYQHITDSGNDRQFGFFHYKDQTESRVRNAVLSGDWPEAVPAELLADITSSIRSERSRGDGRALGALINERLVSLDAWPVYRRALNMPPEERYLFLKDWVMPGRNSSLLRCYAAATPAHPAKPVARSNPVDVGQLESRMDMDSRQIEVGGNLVAPVLELVSLAGQLGRLDELYDEAEQMPMYGVNHVQARLAALALISLERQEAEEARRWLVELSAQLRKMDSFTLHYRWPPVVAASRAVLNEVTRNVAIEMMEFIDDQQLRNGRPGDGVFDSQVRFIRGLGWALRDGLPVDRFGSDGSEQWTTVPLARASTRGPGHPVIHWQHQSGQLLRSAHHEMDVAYFAVPLQGNYEVSCQLTSFGWRETQLGAAGLFTAPVYTHDKYSIGFMRFRRPDTSIDPKLNALSPWYDYRVVVQDGVYTSFIEGRELHQEQLPDHPDPWLSVASGPPYSGGVRQLRISGAPEIPEEISLLSHADLSNWVFDYYDETVTGDSPDWRIEDGELIGRTRPEQAGMNVESIIRYHRPMLEDGEIEYEFRYEPGSVKCHPALDRLVLLLEEDGVREHWLTDGMHDRTGLRPDNRFDEPDYRRGPEQIPLQSGEWNKARLAVAGDGLTLTINDVLVYERPIAPTNLRVFGLFHYADRHELRARGVVHRGDWPRTLPAIEEQQLAPNPGDALVLRADEAPVYWDAGFTDSSFDASSMRFEGTEPGVLIRPDAGGLRMQLPAGEPKPSVIAAGPDFGVRGDFQVDAAFSGLKITPPEQAWGAGIEVHVRFDDDYDSRVQFERRQFTNKNHSLAAAFHGRSADGTSRWFKRDFWRWDEAGALRIIRRGSKMSFLFAPGDSGEFVLLDEFETGTQDVRAVLIRAVCSDQVAGSEVVWESMSVRAGQFLQPEELSGPAANRLDFDLSQEPIGGTWLHVPEPGGDRHARRTQAGIVVQTPANQGREFGLTAASRNYRLTGDFEVTADFELQALDAPRTGYGAGIQLRLSLDDPGQTILHHCRRAYSDGPAAFAAHHVRMDDEGNRLDDTQRVTSDAMSGRLRLRRIGDTVTWEFAAADSDEFQPVFTAVAGTADVNAVDLFCESSQPSSGKVAVAWKRLQIQADRIQQ